MVEHQVVTTSREIKREVEVIPKNTEGTIVHIYPGEKAYEIEFNDLPNNPVVTMYPGEVKVIMEYLKYVGITVINGIWEDITLETGCCYSYGDFQPYKGEVTEDLKKSLYFFCTYLEGSDYSGGSCQKSNHRVFLKQFKDVDGVYDVSGGMGTYSIAIRVDVYESNEELKETINALESYPVIDEDDMSALENEWENEALPDMISDLYRYIDLETYIPDYDIQQEDTEKLEQIIWDGINECNLDWVHENNSAYMSYDRVQPYVEDILLIDNCTALPRLINRDWSCEQTRTLYTEKLSQ